MPYKVDTPDAEAARIATSQHGIVTAKQLAAVGLGRMAIAERARKGRMHRLHRGVYAVGHRAPSWHGRWMAAVLACGEGAVLSHHSAAALWDLLRPIEGAVHVSVPTTSGRAAQRGIHLHRCPALRERLTTQRHRIPSTTMQRTIDDLRSSSLLPPRLLRRAIRQAEHKGVCLDGVESDRTRSDLESAFLDLLRRHRVPLPEVNVRLGRWEVDFLWPGQRVVVEVDTWAYHRGSVSFEDDHARDLDLRQRGFAVLRFTDTQIEEEPARVVADLARALGTGASGG
jgi:very-short-patch-repair endonuclease